MLRQLASVAGWTLVSRATGFARDVMLGAALGAGGLADAFYVAFRLPNHFRAIFGEGAFNAAFVPAYARVVEAEGEAAAKCFLGQIFSLLLASQIVLLVAAYAFMPTLVGWLAPGFADEPTKFATAVALTRITFPYLLFITLATLLSGALNAHRRFAAAAFAPVLLNLAMIAALALAFLFPNAGVASAWGVTISGVAQLALLAWDARRAGLLGALGRPRWGYEMRRFFAALGPAVIGSAGFQIAVFADTIIASLLPTGSVSAIYYADRIYQLPIGVIGIAAGTVLLPEMSRRFAAGDAAGACHAQNRTMALSLALAIPFFVAFLMIPTELMSAAFLRGRFTLSAAQESAAVLAAYGIGIIPVVLIRSAVASFQARGDTRTPMLVALGAVAANVALKLALYQPLGAAGLALATAVGQWLNFGALVTLALRRGTMRPDGVLLRVAGACAIGAAALAGVALALDAPLQALAERIGPFQAIVHVGLLCLAGFLVYATVALGAAQTLGLAPLAPLRRRWSARSS